MKKLLFPLIMLFSMMAFNQKSSAQDYQPFPTTCAKWEVYRCFYFYQPGWHDKYTLTLDGSDTVYQGNTYKKINIIQHTLPGTPFDSLHPPQFFGGMREVNKKIYIFQIWASTNTNPQLVYDFTSTNVGDTIFTKALHGSPNLFGHQVISVDSVKVGNKYHKRLYLQDPKNPSNDEYWIEGIGSSWGLAWATFWSATDNSYDLSCYNTVHKTVYENPNPTWGMCAGTLPVISCDSSSDCDTVTFCNLDMTLTKNGFSIEVGQDSATYQWIDCSNMQPISGAAGKSYVANANGSYAVIVRKGGCSDTSECAEVTGIGVGIESLQRENIRIYPQPSDGKLFVELSAKYNFIQTEVFTVQGKVIQRTSYNDARVIELTLPENKGVYFLRVTSDGESSVHRVIRK